MLKYFISRCNCQNQFTSEKLAIKKTLEFSNDNPLIARKELVEFLKILVPICCNNDEKVKAEINIDGESFSIFESSSQQLTKYYIDNFVKETEYLLQKSFISEDDVELIWKYEKGRIKEYPVFYYKICPK